MVPDAHKTRVVLRSSHSLPPSFSPLFHIDLLSNPLRLCSQVFSRCKRERIIFSHYHKAWKPSLSAIMICKVIPLTKKQSVFFPWALGVRTQHVFLSRDILHEKCTLLELLQKCFHLKLLRELLWSTVLFRARIILLPT